MVDGTSAADDFSRGWLDVSVPLRDSMPVFEGDPLFHRDLAASIARGDVCNVSRLDFGAHSGTHVDAPGHFIEGAPGIESVPIDALVGPAWVVDAAIADRTIDLPLLARLPIPDGETRLLFRTARANLWDRSGFSTDFVGFDAEAAMNLAERGALLVGADYLSVAPFGDPAPTHRAFLERGVIIVEGLDLRNIAPGPYDLICLPLRLVGSDGGPARALLRPRGGSGGG